ncbi:SRR1-like protein isoform X2 [Rhineura floridana]|uniref:SRR1-like protein isoform X2 n=1 Tax=Rhineura floridana TaxID=261503 RepID=UPI002AC832BC|nr:SRR1-like protein isoform X2 [Rhineura floridana]
MAAPEQCDKNREWHGCPTPLFLYGCSPYRRRGGTFPAVSRSPSLSMELRGASEAWDSPGGRKEQKRRRRRRRGEQGRSEPESPAQAGERQRRRLLEACSELQSSEFWDSSLRAIFRSLPKHPATVPAVEKALSAFGNLQLSTPAETVLEPSFQLQEEPYYNRGNSLQCVCYGIGNFSSCIKIPKNLCYVFDPVFSTLEIEVLNNFDLTVLLENEEGKRCVQEPTIFYMVHCGKALYNNLLWSNWSVDALSRMVILGNSFKGTEERVLNKIFQKDYSYIAKVLPATDETDLPSHPQYLDIFNDTSVHCFPLEKLKHLPPEIWDFQEEPVYQDEDQLEIIRNKQ